MKFTKMEGCGNDYIYVNGAEERIPQNEKPGLVRRLSDRNFGIGGDGVIFINPVPDHSADFEMEMYNSDGSRAEMCGNGIRCIGKYVYDKQLTDKRELTITSCGKKKYLTLFLKDGKVNSVRVDMGAPILTPSEIPVSIPDTSAMSKDSIVRQPITVDGREYHITCVSMGNPHAVVFLDEKTNLAEMKLADIGPYFEHHSFFPARTNTEFVHVDSRREVHMRVWERGTGETLACGTGCCAVATAAILNGLTDNMVTVNVRGGQIICELDKATGHMFMTGPATTVFEGTI